MWRQVTTQVLTTQVLTTWWQEGLPCASALRGPGSGPRPPRRTSLDLPSGTRLSRALGQGQGPTLRSPVARPCGRLATAPRRPESLYQHGVIKGGSLPTGERDGEGKGRGAEGDRCRPSNREGATRPTRWGGRGQAGAGEVTQVQWPQGTQSPAPPQPGKRPHTQAWLRLCPSPRAPHVPPSGDRAGCKPRKPCKPRASPVQALRGPEAWSRATSKACLQPTHTGSTARGQGPGGRALGAPQPRWPRNLFIFTLFLRMTEPRRR